MFFFHIIHIFNSTKQWHSNHPNRPKFKSLLLETILHWDDTEIGLVTEELATKTATKTTKSDSEEKATIGKRRARDHRRIRKPTLSFWESSWESIELCVGRELVGLSGLFCKRCRHRNHLSGDRSTSSTKAERSKWKIKMGTFSFCLGYLLDFLLLFFFFFQSFLSLFWSILIFLSNNNIAPVL